MGYSSSKGRKPFERASRSAHHHIIRDQSVQELLENCWVPPAADEVNLEGTLDVNDITEIADPIEYVIAVDGGYTETYVREGFPSASICFFQFGALLLSKKDLIEVERQPFIDPEDMAKLKNIERVELALPSKCVRLSDSDSFVSSFRTILFNFFQSVTLKENESLADTLSWLVFRQYNTNRDDEHKRWNLATNPNTGFEILLEEQDLEDNQWECPLTGSPIYITDLFRLHEVVDDELGARGVLGYVTNLIEQILLIHLIRQLLKKQPESLKKTLFIKDGLLGFFGQTANMHKPMKDLIQHLNSVTDLYLVGLEKSGAFVEHAQEIQGRLDKSSLLVLSNEHIYTYILPGTVDPSRPYGSTTNYGHKVIFKSNSGDMYVASVPAIDIVADPDLENLIGIDVILKNLEILRCDMYESAVLPVALVNKLVSLADHPSSRILQKFAVNAVG